VQGLPAFASVAALPEVPDAAIIAVPGEAAIQAMDDLGARGCKSAIVFTAGFAEVDEAGAAMQERLVAAARRHGMRMLGPNCLGLFNAAIGFYPIFSLSFEQGWPIRGNIGIASQSGAYGTHVFAVARQRGLGTTVCVTTGNEADVSLGEAIGWMAQAPEVEVICAYAEGIRESAGFVAALDLARRNHKPVIMMKVGSSALGGAAAKSHTASIAGDDAVTQAVLDEFGVLRARTTEEMLDIAYAASRRIYPVHNSLGVLTVSGGAGVLISDASEAVGLPMPEMPQASQDKLRSLISFCAPRNPVDCTAQAVNQTELFGDFLEATAGDGGYPSVLVFLTQTGGSTSLAPKLRPFMRDAIAKRRDRLWVLSAICSREKVREYEEDGFLVFEDPTRAVNAIAAMGRFGAYFARQEAGAVGALPSVALPAQTPPAPASSWRGRLRPGPAGRSGRTCLACRPRTSGRAARAAGRARHPRGAEWPADSCAIARGSRRPRRATGEAPQRARTRSRMAGSPPGRRRRRRAPTARRGARPPRNRSA
jgi:acyl-CoA synthetase (NDP forming)